MDHDLADLAGLLHRDQHGWFSAWLRERPTTDLVAVARDARRHGGSFGRTLLAGVVEHPGLLRGRLS